MRRRRRGDSGGNLQMKVIFVDSEVEPVFDLVKFKRGISFCFKITSNDFGLFSVAYITFI
jgi:hypothetical protein